MRTSILDIVGLAVVAAAAGGCDQGPSTYPVEGHLIVGGQLAGNASVAFHRLPKRGAAAVPGAAGYCPVGVSEPDGSFHLTTLRPDDGAPEGEYAVTVIWPKDLAGIDECECPDPAQHDRLRGEYANPQTTPLRASVRKKGNIVNLVVMEGHGRPGPSFPPGPPL